MTELLTFQNNQIHVDTLYINRYIIYQELRNNHSKTEIWKTYPWFFELAKMQGIFCYYAEGGEGGEGKNIYQNQCCRADHFIGSLNYSTNMAPALIQIKFLHASKVIRYFPFLAYSLANVDILS